MSTSYKISDKVKQKVLGMSIKEIRFEMAKYNILPHPSEYYDLLNSELNRREELYEGNIKR